MTSLFCRSALLVLLASVISPTFAGELTIPWPADWQVQPLPALPDGTGERQRAVKNDANGDPQMVMEMTRSPLQPGHVVNLPSVLLQMRKTVQINFVHTGFMSVCTQIHPSTLGGLDAVESTCTITQNGAHVMTQTLVAAASKQTAWSLSYAGSADGYKLGEADVQRIRAGLKLAD